MVQNIYHLEQHGENHTLGIHYPKKESSQKKTKQLEYPKCTQHMEEADIQKGLTSKFIMYIEFRSQNPQPLNYPTPAVA